VCTTVPETVAAVIVVPGVIASAAGLNALLLTK